jgi:hypothetical protein
MTPELYKFDLKITKKITIRYLLKCGNFKQWNSALCIVLIRAYRVQFWKGKKNKNFGEKNEGNSNDVQPLKIIKLLKHLLIEQTASYKSLPHSEIQHWDRILQRI